MFSHNKKMAAIFWAVIFFAAADRCLKALALAGANFNLIGEILKFNFKANYFIAFSLPLTGVWLTAMIIAIVLLLIYYLIKNWLGCDWPISLNLLAIILGAASNLFDRFKYGHVIDYLDLKFFTVFNIADALIVVGVIVLLLLEVKKQAT